MSNLTIFVANPPDDFPENGMSNLRLIVQGKKRNLEGSEVPNGLQFEVPIEFHPDGRPRGEFVNVYGDKRPFVYLQWWGTNAAGLPETFRRIKLYWDQLPAPDAGGNYKVTVSGVDKKGHPACSTAIII
jgi:hypothetical protein